MLMAYFCSPSGFCTMSHSQRAHVICSLPPSLLSAGCVENTLADMELSVRAILPISQIFCQIPLWVAEVIAVQINFLLVTFEGYIMLFLCRFCHI